MPISPDLLTGSASSAGSVRAVDVHLLDLPLVEPFAAAHGTTDSRTIAVLAVTVDGPDGPVVGWGECSALPAATYTAESAAGCYRLLSEEVAPELVAEPGEPADPTDAPSPLDGAPMARSAVEMAVLDARLRADSRSLASWLALDRAEVAAGASLGLDRPELVVRKARGLIEDGYRRLKVKIQPGHDHEVLGLLRADATIASADVEIHLDANGAYGAGSRGGGDVDRLVALAEGGADALEQPLVPTEIEAAARLVERLAALAQRDGRPVVPVVADEAVTTAADAAALADRRALSGVSIKPARVGGLTAAVALHDLCRKRGLRATAGGMLETGLGRHALTALAGLPGFDLIGDLSPARRWLAADPWPDLTMADGSITVPTGPGVAPEPDLDVLARFQIAHRHVERDG